MIVVDHPVLTSGSTYRAVYQCILFPVVTCEFGPTMFPCRRTLSGWYWGRHLKKVQVASLLRPFLWFEQLAASFWQRSWIQIRLDSRETSIGYVRMVVQWLTMPEWWPHATECTQVQTRPSSHQSCAYVQAVAVFLFQRDFLGIEIPILHVQLWAHEWIYQSFTPMVL